MNSKYASIFQLRIKNTEIKSKAFHWIPALTTSSRVLRRRSTDSEIDRKTRTAIRLQFCTSVLRKIFDSLSQPGMYMVIASINLQKTRIVTLQTHLNVLTI